MNSLVSTTSRSFSLNSSAIWAKVWNLYTVGAKMISLLSAIREAEKASIAIGINSPLIYKIILTLSRQSRNRCQQNLLAGNGLLDGGHDVGGAQAVLVH